MQFKLENQLKCKAITDTFNIIQANKAAIRSHYIAIKLVCNRLIAPNVPSDFWWPYGQEYFYFVLRKKILTVIIYLSSFFLMCASKKRQTNKHKGNRKRKERYKHSIYPSIFIFPKRSSVVSKSSCQKQFLELLYQTVHLFILKVSVWRCYAKEIFFSLNYASIVK